MTSTPQLYDEHEEDWAVKLHLGCGSVYLSGYTNIDMQGALATSLPEDYVRAHSSTIQNYYSRDGEFDSLPSRGEIIADQHLDVRYIDKLYAAGTVDKVIAIQSLEHLTPIDFMHVISKIRDCIRRPGVFIISVPDIEETLDWMEDPQKRDFAVRHLRGSMVDEWSRHKSWWTRESLRETLEGFGFSSVTELDNIHCYPAIVMKGRKLEH